MRELVVAGIFKGELRDELDPATEMDLERASQSGQNLGLHRLRVEGVQGLGGVLVFAFFREGEGDSEVRHPALDLGSDPQTALMRTEEMQQLMHDNPEAVITYKGLVSFNEIQNRLDQLRPQQAPAGMYFRF